MTRPADIDILRSGELMICDVTGETDAGAEFIDSYAPPSVHAKTMIVIDSGRVYLHCDTVDDFVAVAAERGLTVTRREGT